jgi:hypothetical protein
MNNWDRATVRERFLVGSKAPPMNWDLTAVVLVSQVVPSGSAGTPVVKGTS